MNTHISEHSTNEASARCHQLLLLTADPKTWTFLPEPVPVQQKLV